MGGGRGGGRRGRGPRCRLFYINIFIFSFLRGKSNEAKGTPNASIIKAVVSTVGRRFAGLEACFLLVTVFLFCSYSTNPD